MLELSSIRSSLEQYCVDHPGLFLVSTQLTGDKCLITIDHDTAPIDIAMCVELSRYLRDTIEGLDDVDVEVGSAGLTAPLLMPRQYRKYIGKKLELLLKNGTKHRGVLSEVTEETCTIIVEEKIRPEGEKRKRTIETAHTYSYREIKRAVYMIEF